MNAVTKTLVSQRYLNICGRVRTDANGATDCDREGSSSIREFSRITNIVAKSSGYCSPGQVSQTIRDAFGPGNAKYRTKQVIQCDPNPAFINTSFGERQNLTIADEHEADSRD